MQTCFTSRQRRPSFRWLLLLLSTTLSIANGKKIQPCSWTERACATSMCDFSRHKTTNLSIRKQNQSQFTIPSEVKRHNGKEKKKKRTKRWKFQEKKTHKTRHKSKCKCICASDSKHFISIRTHKHATHSRRSIPKDLISGTIFYSATCAPVVFR